MADFEGQIWVLPDGEELLPLCTIKRNKKKVQALNEKNREQTVAEDKLLWQLPGSVAAPGQWPETLAKLKERLEALEQEIDVRLLWETAMEMETSDLDELAELYFGGDTGVEHRIALWRALATDRTHFKRKGKVWELRTAEQVDELLKQRAVEEARAQFQTAASEWLGQFVASEGLPELPPALEGFLDRLDCWMRGDKDKDLQTLLESAAGEGNNPRELAFDILQQGGRLPPEADRDIVVAGLKPEFSEPVLAAAAQVPPWRPDGSEPVLELDFSIDDDDTREVDDALAIHPEGDGWRIDIAIADPARVVHQGDALDREAMRRGTTVYLPTQTILMLPDAVSCDISSLTASELRSSVVVQAWLDAEGNLVRSEISRQAARVARRLNYAQADELIAQGADRVANLHRLSEKLAAQRQAEGAISLQRPEYKIKVENDTISVTMIERDSPSRTMVAEMMILANHVAARYARDHQVPIIYRTQDPPEKPIDPEQARDPLAFQKIRRQLKPSSLSLHPGGHSGLGLSAYTQLSSPLRRFADLVMQRQLVAHLSGEPLPYDQDELFKVLATAENTAREARGLENAAKRRWFMEYLRREWLEQPVQALLVEETKVGFKAELQPWGVDALISGPGKREVGMIVTAKIEKLRPKAGQIRLRWEPSEPL